MRSGYWEFAQSFFVSLHLGQTPIGQCLQPIPESIVDQLPSQQELLVDLPADPG